MNIDPTTPIPIIIKPPKKRIKTVTVVNPITEILLKIFNK